jgi:hypothetical protein
LAAWAFAVCVGVIPTAAFPQSLSSADHRSPNRLASISSEAALFDEPRIVVRAIDVATRTVGDGSENKSGFYPDLSNMIAGAGWISGGPGYRQWLYDDRVLIDASAAVSWRYYKTAQGRFELPRLARGRLRMGSQVYWQDLTQVTYFGDGPSSSEDERSEYRIKSVNVVGYAVAKPARHLSVSAQLGWLGGPSLHTPGGSFRRGNPASQDVFPNDPALTLSEQPDYIHGEVAVARDTRDYGSHPTRGGLYRAAWSEYSDRESGSFSFARFAAEAAQFIPVADGRLVFAVRGWLVTTATDADAIVPLYLVPSLGGGNTLRGYADYRFHDRNLLLFNGEARVALFRHLDAAIFMDAGNVAPRVSDLDIAKRSYGAGLRMHNGRATFVRFDVGHGPEGWRFLFKLSDPLNLARLARRTAAVPFVP